jgi:uncharacterized protein (DUF1800 family)
MEVTKQIKNQHLLWRAGFGIMLDDLSSIDSISPARLYKKLEKESASEIIMLDTASATVKNALLLKQNPLEMQMSPEEQKKFNGEQRRIINRQSNEDIKRLTLAWLNQMATKEGRLREKMSLFWHGHFACRLNNSLYQQQLLNTIRQNALGNFGTLLRSVSKSASMLSFLNNQQNKKKRPNENFAREVMELFTMGRGNYTETDVKEAARAFTGWQYEKDGSFVFREKAHDDGMKAVLGTSGNLSGDDVLDIILKQKQTAIYITQKIYRHFVNEEIDKQHITWLSDRFYDNNYDIGKLMRDIFTSDWFYEERNIGTHIKSPVEYLTGIRCILPMTLQNEEVQVLLQRILGQWLFNPPNVAGWPGGTAWIDSSSLMLRLRVPGLIKNDETINLKPKSNDDVQMGSKEMFDINVSAKKKKAGSRYQVLAQINWNAFRKALGKMSNEEAYRKLESMLLQVPLSGSNKDAVIALAKNTTSEEYMQTLTIALMSVPEYQLS